MASTITGVCNHSMLHHYQTLLAALAPTALATWAEKLPQDICDGLSIERFGDMPNWLLALDNLPHTEPSFVRYRPQIDIGRPTDCDSDTLLKVEQQLHALIPWRKGPFTVHGIKVDSEWRSDWKWERLLPHIKPLLGKTVLDVGCGNGYHCLRSFGEGADRIIGIDPSPRFVVQFYMIKHFIDHIPVDVLPLSLEQLPANLSFFDTTFSMGVLYHRRSPIDHLLALKSTLKPSGQLVLETLLVEGGEGTVLVPKGRYAQMNNVWFLPSADTLIGWMKKCGFKNARLVDINYTSVEEQRTTPWMHFHSLAQFLNPDNPKLTIEGYPAPIRGIFIADN